MQTGLYSRAVALGSVAAALVVNGPARAEGGAKAFGTLETIAVGGEILIPDTGFAVSTDPVEVILGWPVEFVLPGLGGAECEDATCTGPHRAWVVALVEPQFVPRGSQFRGIVGTRGYLPLSTGTAPYLAPAVEVSGIVDDGGAGLILGGSVGGYVVGLEGPRALGLLTVRYRYLMLVQPRHEVCLDLVNFAF